MNKTIISKMLTVLMLVGSLSLGIFSMTNGKYNIADASTKVLKCDTKNCPIMTDIKKLEKTAKAYEKVDLKKARINTANALNLSAKILTQLHYKYKTVELEKYIKTTQDAATKSLKASTPHWLIDEAQLGINANLSGIKDINKEINYHKQDKTLDEIEQLTINLNDNNYAGNLKDIFAKLSKVFQGIIDEGKFMQNK